MQTSPKEAEQLVNSDAGDESDGDNYDFDFTDTDETASSAQRQDLFRTRHSATYDLELTTSGDSTVSPNQRVYHGLAIVDGAGSDINDSWIRILRISPGTFGDPICCTLVKRPLWDAGEYIALSYSWGAGPRSKEMQIESRSLPKFPFFVSPHLWDALQRLRHELQAVSVWIDAICIDQANPIERAQQVPIMAQIFNQASQVKVWLGEDKSLEHWGMVSDGELFWSLCQHRSPWWARLWIVQECAYAKECPTVMLGAHTTSLEHFIERWHTAIRTGEGKWNPALLERHLALLQMPFEAWKAQNERTRHRLPLYQRLQETAGRNCSVLHDRIYALLSLIDENEANAIVVDYRMPYSELLLEVAEKLKHPPYGPLGCASFRDLLEQDPELKVAISDGRTSQEYSYALVRASWYGHRRAALLVLNRIGNLQHDQVAREAPVKALLAAGSGGHAEVVRLLLRSIQADPSFRQDEYRLSATRALQAASIQGHRHAVLLLLESGADANGFLDNQSILRAASAGGQTEIVRLLLDHGAAPSMEKNSECNALYTASARGYSEIVRLLLEHGAGPNGQEDGNDGNALYTASIKGYKLIVKLLLEANADVDVHGGHFGHALVAAAYMGNTDIVSLLLDSGAHPDQQGQHRDGTSLYFASARGHTSTVRLLLERGSDANIKGGKYGSARRVAAAEGHEDIASLLLEKGAEPHEQREFLGTALHAAAVRGREELVRLLLAKGEDVNASGGYYGNALQAAAYKGHHELCSVLLSHGADVNAQGGSMGSALQAAASQGHSAIVSFLLEHKADVNAQGGFYGNALQAAVVRESAGLASLLLNRGANVNAQGGFYGTALQAAVIRNSHELLSLLIGRGADVNAQGGHYGNALEAAAAQNSKELVRQLRALGADVKAQGGLYQNCTPRCLFATRCKHVGERRRRVV